MEKRTKKKIILISVVSVVLSAMLFLKESVFTDSEAVVVRNSYGEGKKSTEYEVAVKGEGEHTLQIEAGEQEYTAEEIQEIFCDITKRLDKIILGENKSFDRIERDLNLVTEMEDYPVQIEWQLDSYTVLNMYGQIQEEHLQEDGTLVELRGTISYNGEEAVYIKPVMVFPLTREGADKFFYDLGEEVKHLEETTRDAKNFTLPKSFGGKELVWTEKTEKRWFYVLFLGVGLSAYLIYREQEAEKEREKTRKEALLREYPGMVSKFTMLLDTGATVRNAWEKIVQNYEKQKEEMGSSAVYEEMEFTLREIQGGISEAESYERFGKRCNVAVYMKFGALLSQNLRKGSRGISDILRMEAIQAFENRKSTARRLGEEAGTKLLIPMLGMLAVVFIMVMVPAFLSMQS